jgi:dTDP-4-dehydrorhamnose reductase
MVVNLFAFGQKDSIYIQADLSARILHVKQKIVYHNSSQKYLSKIKLLNLVAAYQNRQTRLLKENSKTEKPTSIMQKKTKKVSCSILW